MLVAERAGRVLGQRVAVALAVCGPEKGGDDLEVPLGHVEGLTPEIGEAEVDVELEEIDSGRALGHGKKVGTGSDGIGCREWARFGTGRAACPRRRRSRPRSRPSQRTAIGRARSASSAASGSTKIGRAS